MATDTITAGAKPAKTAIGSAYWDSVIAMEMLELDAERISETAYALSTAEAFDSNAQAAFYALGQLAQLLQGRCKVEGERFEALSDRHREPAR